MTALDKHLNKRIEQKKREGVLCLIFLGICAIFIISNYFIQEPKRKALKEMRNKTNEVHIIKLAFDTGYKACLLDVIEVAIDSNDEGGYNKLLNFLDYKAEEISK